MKDKLTPSQQIAGYLILTRAHYYLKGRHMPSPCIAFRSVIAAEMSVDTYITALELKEKLPVIGGRTESGAVAELLQTLGESEAVNG